MQKDLIVLSQISLKSRYFEKGESNWIDVLPMITKRFINRIHSSTKLFPIEGSLKENEGFVYKNLVDKRKKIKPKFQVNDLVRVFDLEKRSQKEIQLIGLTFYIQLQKLLLIQYRVITLIIYQEDIMKPY